MPAGSRQIHTRPQRNEQVSLDTRLWLAEECDRARALLGGVMGALLDLAGRRPDPSFPHTHMRRAQACSGALPVAYFEMFAGTRSLQPGPCQRQRAALGSGARPAAVSFDCDAMAHDLAFRRHAQQHGCFRHRDSCWISSTPPAWAMIHSAVCRRLILYSSEEFGWLELADAVTSGSSLMPQKEPRFARADPRQERRVMGCLVSLMTP